MATLEKEIERVLIDMVKRHGGMCLKWVCPGWIGVPDRICLLPGGRIFFVETKRPSGGSRGEMQKKWAQWLRRLGFAHLWIHTREEIADFERLIVYERI